MALFTRDEFIFTFLCIFAAVAVLACTFVQVSWPLAVIYLFSPIPIFYMNGGREEPSPKEGGNSGLAASSPEVRKIAEKVEKRILKQYGKNSKATRLK